jgi:hypothetical protein
MMGDGEMEVGWPLDLWEKREKVGKLNGAGEKMREKGRRVT